MQAAYSDADSEWSVDADTQLSSAVGDDSVVPEEDNERAEAPSQQAQDDRGGQVMEQATSLFSLH